MTLRLPNLSDFVQRLPDNSFARALAEVFQESETLDEARERLRETIQSKIREHEDGLSNAKD